MVQTFVFHGVLFVKSYIQNEFSDRTESKGNHGENRIYCILVM